MNVKITEHICERYCERVLGIPVDGIVAHIAENRPQIIQEIKDLCEDSSLVYRGQLEQHQPPGSFYVNGDIILILSYENKNAITLFRPNYGYPQTVNRKVVRALTQEIKKNQRRLKEIIPGVEKRINHKREHLKTIDAQLGRCRKKIEKLEAEKKKVKRQIWYQNSRAEELNKNIAALASRLILDGKEFCKRKERAK